MLLSFKIKTYGYELTPLTIPVELVVDGLMFHLQPLDFLVSVVLLIYQIQNPDSTHHLRLWHGTGVDIKSLKAVSWAFCVVIATFLECKSILRYRPIGECLGATEKNIQKKKR